ncbi:MAG: potassium-transporting ATPase subunit KdpC [Bacteroidota bacterium]
MKAHLRPALMLLLLFTVITGVIYPLLVTGIAQLVFPAQANGSILENDGRAVGSVLIGQQFTEKHYFWGRLSATSPVPYNAASSSGSNYGPLNPALLGAVRTRIAALHSADSTNTLPIPVDLVTASGSGLDPDISVAAALYQAARVARARNLTEEQVRTLIDRSTEGRDLGFLGEPRVNVLKLNVSLDEFVSASKRTN